MARTRTLAELRTDVCDRADVVDGGTTGRHTTSRLNRYINQAIQRYLSMVTSAGSQDWYCKRTGVLTMSTSDTVDASGWAPCSYIALPGDFAQLVRIDIIVSGTVMSLSQFERAERNMFRTSPFWLNGRQKGQPVYYRIGGKNAAGTQVAQVIPSADSAYQYEVWYIPVFVDLSLDADTFDGIAGYEEYIVNSAAISALLNDGNTNTPLYASMLRTRDEDEATMKFKHATMGGAGRRLDTEAMRTDLARYARGILR
jgi:hypothetical protein